MDVLIHSLTGGPFDKDEASTNTLDINRLSKSQIYVLTAKRRSTCTTGALWSSHNIISSCDPPYPITSYPVKSYRNAQYRKPIWHVASCYVMSCQVSLTLFIFSTFSKTFTFTCILLLTQIYWRRPVSVSSSICMSRDLSYYHLANAVNFFPSLFLTHLACHLSSVTPLLFSVSLRFSLPHPRPKLRT